MKDHLGFFQLILINPSGCSIFNLTDTFFLLAIVLTRIRIPNQIRIWFQLSCSDPDLLKNESGCATLPWGGGGGGRQLFHIK